MKLRSSNWLVRPYSHIQSSALLLGLQLTALENIKIKSQIGARKMHSGKDSGEKSDRGLSQKPETPTDLTAKCRREQSK